LVCGACADNLYVVICKEVYEQSSYYTEKVCYKNNWRDKEIKMSSNDECNCKTSDNS